MVSTAGLVFFVFLSFFLWDKVNAAPPLLLAPMMDLTPCLLGKTNQTTGATPAWHEACTRANGSASHLIESTLQELQVSPSSRWTLGYTLQVPLMSLLEPTQDGWKTNDQALDRLVQTVRDNPRPLVLYLFSSHFAAPAPVEAALAQNPDNLAFTPQGPLPVDAYYTIPIYPWSVARTDNPITQYRVQVIQSVLKKMCALPQEARVRIKGITLLGETHQLFPKFETGMGFTAPYSVSDYSPISVKGFQAFLNEKFGDLQQLNKSMGSSYPDFSTIQPPSKNIRTDKLTRFQEHIDSFAAGTIPVTGWIFAPKGAGVVKVYLNGQHLSDAPVHLGRQDVLAAHPAFKTADVGWRYDLDFSQLPAGIHQIDLAYAQQDHALLKLGTRAVVVMDSQQKTPVVMPLRPLPQMVTEPHGLLSALDEPRQMADYYFNPLAREWLQFRELQVVHYLQYFNALVASTCFADTPRYTHQIVPQYNPGWDASKFAVNASLAPQKALRMGISLYGEASYGQALAGGYKALASSSYGVTEFHPLTSLGTVGLGKVLTSHQQNGADFLSFFLETKWQNQSISAAPNLFSFDSENTKFASNQLYSSLKKLLARDD